MRNARVRLLQALHHRSRRRVTRALAPVLAKVARRAQAALSLDGLRAVLTASDIEGKSEVLASLARSYSNYVVNVDAAPEAALMSPGLA